MAVLNCDEYNSEEIKHVYNEIENLIGRYAVDFDINDLSNPTEMVQVIDMKVWRHALTFVTHQITWGRTSAAKLSPLQWKSRYYIPSKSTQSDYNTP